MVYKRLGRTTPTCPKTQRPAGSLSVVACIIPYSWRDWHVSVGNGARTTFGRLSSGLIGIILGAGSVGFLVGALLPDWLAKRIGLGPMLIAGMMILAISDFVLPLAAGAQALVVALLIGAQISFGLGLTLYNVGQVSLRQSITPDHLLGRMNATLNFAVAGLIPLGALLGGFAGEWLGLRETLLLAAGGELLAVVWLVLSPVRRVQHNDSG